MLLERACGAADAAIIAAAHGAAADAKRAAADAELLDGGSDDEAGEGEGGGECAGAGAGAAAGAGAVMGAKRKRRSGNLLTPCYNPNPNS